MPVWIHRTTKGVLRSVAQADLPEVVANYIEEPDLSAVAGQPVRYWLITGDTVSLVDAATQTAIDAALLIATRDALADDIDRVETFLRAFALVMLDELNRHANRTNAILDAIDAATNLASLKSAIGAINDLPIGTPANLKAAVRAKLDT